MAGIGVSSFELQQRASKFEKQAQRHAAAEQRKAEKERILAQRASERREAHLKAVAELRARQAEEAEKAELERQAALEHNRGIELTATLQAAPLSLDVAEAKGVRRSADKVILPAYLSNELMKQGAHEHGSPFWRIAARDGRATVASALEFSAPDGVVMLPPKVVESLWGAGAECHGEVHVAYQRLEPGTYVSFTPETADFAAAAGDAVEALLQATLMRHTALSEGDWITVTLPPPAAPQRLQVAALRPGPAVSLLDTDLEADVTPSAEFMARIRREQDAARASVARQAEVEAEEARLRADAAAKAQADAAAAAAAAAEIAQRRLIVAAQLPAEPNEACGARLLHGLFQMPDGSRHRRRFCLDEPAQRMYDFCESVGAGGLAPGGYRIVTRFPRRVVDAGAGAAASIADCRLGAGQEVFVLEATGG